MPWLTLKQDFSIPPLAVRRPRRAAYALPMLFTAGNIFLGFIAIFRAMKGLCWRHRTTRPESELRSRGQGHRRRCGSGWPGRPNRAHDQYLQRFWPRDGFARRRHHFRYRARRPGLPWGVQFVKRGGFLADHRAGYFIAFLFLLCGAARLARFNVQTNPVPKNPGRPDRKYFVGLPIPAGAALVAAIVYASDSVPLEWSIFSAPGWPCLRCSPS